MQEVAENEKAKAAIATEVNNYLRLGRKNVAASPLPKPFPATFKSTDAPVEAYSCLVPSEGGDSRIEEILRSLQAYDGGRSHSPACSAVTCGLLKSNRFFLCLAYSAVYCNVFVWCRRKTSLL